MNEMVHFAVNWFLPIALLCTGLVIMISSLISAWHDGD